MGESLNETDQYLGYTNDVLQLCFGFGNCVQVDLLQDTNRSEEHHHPGIQNQQIRTFLVAIADSLQWLQVTSS